MELQAPTIYIRVAKAIYVSMTTKLSFQSSKRQVQTKYPIKCEYFSFASFKLQIEPIQSMRSFFSRSSYDSAIFWALNKPITMGPSKINYPGILRSLGEARAEKSALDGFDSAYRCARVCAYRWDRRLFVLGRSDSVLSYQSLEFRFELDLLLFHAVFFTRRTIESLFIFVYFNWNPPYHQSAMYMQ